MSSIDSSLQWFKDRVGKVTYSMERRNGPNSYDCSSSEYYALKQGALLPADTPIGNTDSLFRDLERNGFTQLQPNAQGNYDTQKGDVFIWGKRGASGGAAGHTGEFDDADNIYNCNYGYNGIVRNNYDQLRGWNGYPEQTFYRYTGVSVNPVNAVDQIIEVGSRMKFDKIFRVDDLQLIGGVWQVRTNELCSTDFTWEDNGIPAEPLIEVDADGFATADQNLDVGSFYKLPGAYTALDVGDYGGGYIALVEWNGLKFWLDIGPATEIDSNDGGTPTPGQRPAPQPPVSSNPVPTTPVTPPVILQPEPIPDVPVITTPAPQPPANNPPVTNVPKEDTKVAFTEDQQNKLRSATEDIQKTIDAVAETDTAKELVAGISTKTKLKVYIVGDALLGLGAITPQLVVLAVSRDPFVLATTLSAVFATSGLFILTMFGIYKNGTK